MTQVQQHRLIMKKDNFEFYVEETIEENIACSDEMEIILEDGINMGQSYLVKMVYHDKNYNLLNEGYIEKQKYEISIKEKINAK